MSSINKTVALLLVLLTFVLIIPTHPATSQLQQTQIKINSDGSVVGTDKIIQDGNTYTLTGNLSSSVTVERNNIVLDGDGFTIQGQVDIQNYTIINLNPYSEPLNQTAISLTDRANVTIKNVSITYFGVGIALVDSLNCTILGNNFYSNNGYPGAIYLNDSSNNWITQNYLNKTAQIGIGLWSSSSNNIVSDNKISEGGSAGILTGGANNTILGNNIEKGLDGIDIGSLYNVIVGNNISSATGIELNYAANTLISKNLISPSDIGIFMVSGNYNNTFFFNTISNCTATLGFNDDNNSTFYYNNFLNCSRNVSYLNEFYKGPHYYSAPQIIETHNWDNGTLGNYWSDYLTKYPTAEQVNGSGAYDTPYAVAPEGYPYLFYDFHPLVSPVEFTQNDTIQPSWVSPTPTSTPVDKLNFMTIFAVGIVIVVLVVVLSILFARRYRKTALVKKP